MRQTINMNLIHKAIITFSGALASFESASWRAKGAASFSEPPPDRSPSEQLSLA